MKAKGFALLVLIAGLAGCKSRPLQPSQINNSPMAQTLPKATVYKMQGDATAANVPVTINPTTGQIVSFPAPADVVGQEPVSLGQGWLLDRRGINANSRFLRWTYAEYQSLEDTPTPTELKEAIIPDARVVDLRRLDMTPWQATENIGKVKKILNID